MSIVFFRSMRALLTGSEWLEVLDETNLLSVINQIEGPIITLRDGRNQVNIATNLWQNSNVPGQVDWAPALERFLQPQGSGSGY
jgi:hypothetical protein